MEKDEAVLDSIEESQDNSQNLDQDEDEDTTEAAADAQDSKFKSFLSGQKLYT